MVAERGSVRSGPAPSDPDSAPRGGEAYGLSIRYDYWRPNPWLSCEVRWSRELV
jgi:hypothetical protein